VNEPHNVYSYKTRRQNNCDIAFELACFISAITCYGFTLAVPSIKLPWLLQLLSVIFSTAGIYAVTRYTLPSFVYTLREKDSDGSDSDVAPYDFEVNRIQGKKSTLIASLSMKNAVYFARWERGQRGGQKKSTHNKKKRRKKGAPTVPDEYKKTPRYAFYNTMRPNILYTAVFNTDEGYVRIDFEPDENFALLFSKLLPSEATVELPE
jgi:hypothetical protein